MPNGKAQLTLNQLPEVVLEKDELLLMTIRSHDRYRGIHNKRRVIFLNPIDMEKRGIEKRQVLNLISRYHGQERKAEQLAIPHDILEGNAAAYFPETNLLVPIDEIADKSRTLINKSIKITLEKSF